MQRGPQHSQQLQAKLNTSQTKRQALYFVSIYLQVVIQSEISGSLLPDQDENAHDNEQNADIQQHNWHLPHIDRNKPSSFARVTSDKRLQVDRADSVQGDRLLGCRCHASQGYDERSIPDSEKRP
jgi:hypothetical protein